MPASGSEPGRVCGRLPGWAWGRHSEARATEHTVVPLGGHHCRAPTVAAPVASRPSQGSSAGSSRTSPRPSSASPCRGARPDASRMVAAASRDAASSAQVLGDNALPDASPSAAAASASSVTKQWYSVAISRFSPDSKVLAASSRCNRSRAVSRHSTLSAYQGKAHAATKSPAASAMTWLLADEPRLRKAARCSWCHQICRTASGLASKRSLTLGHSSSIRRIHVQLISRTPSSMPLIQLTPERNGFARHHDRSCLATASA